MRKEGFSMAELLAVLTIVAVLTAVAAPRLNGYLARQRVRSALNLLAGDIAHARMTAVRTGRGAVLRFHPDPSCAAVGRTAGHAYTVAERGAGNVRARRSSARAPGGGPVCLRTNGADSLVFNSRGLVVPFANRTVWSVQGTTRDSLTVSAVGRVYRRF
jgi:prepilin-type N-terminal cleavage/methylation domain-containing protein